ncbi:hypothetical protein ACFO8O_01770 [Hephaestia sp. GCM10023244]|uniref:phage head spike fiber domain-containing protein n=1 Tax=unclassified Hephaestia TaxID=2631281 RepID=UPI00207758B7|nr:hypothetical protein [Hephaestia sp. MAHUQ-44]MCM8729699.1 hypothetical protein [Hephaestia sp. MAHUQ-44]
MIAIGFGPSLTTHRAPAKAAFDFTSGVLPAGATLTRASSASRFDAAGMLTTEPVDGVRFDHDPVTRALLGVLIEPERRNEALRSQDLAHTAWSKVSGLVVTSDTHIAPDGTTTADTLTDSSTAQYGSAAQTFGVATQRTASVFVRKDATGRSDRFAVLRGGPPLSDLSIDTATGELLRAGAGIVSGTVRDCGSFWRLVLVGGAAADRIEFYTAAGAGAAWPYAVTATGSTIVWGFQSEQGATATSYIPTDAAPATRAADVLTLDWGRFAIPDGPLPLRYLFDDGSSQDGTATVTGGLATVPTTLARPWLRRVERR